MQNADAFAITKTTITFTPQIPPFPWLWPPRESHGQWKALCLCFPVCTATYRTVVFRACQRTGVKVNISKTSWSLLTLFPVPQTLPLNPVPQTLSMMPILPNNLARCCPPQPRVKDSSSSLLCSPVSLLVLHLVFSPTSSAQGHFLWPHWHKKSLKVKSSKKISILSND